MCDFRVYICIFAQAIPNSFRQKMQVSAKKNTVIHIKNAPPVFQLDGIVSTYTYVFFSSHL